MRSSTSSQDEIRRRVRRVVAMQVEGVVVPDDDDARLDETMGLDSAATISLLVDIEAEFGIAVDESDELGSFQTVDRITRFVSWKMGSSSPKGAS